MKENEVITLLDYEEWRIIKRVNIVSKNIFGIDINIGSIVYHRVLNTDYYIAESTKKEPIEKLLDFHKPSQFPVDEIDIIILNAIKEKFPNSNVVAHLANTNRDFERLDKSLNCPSSKTIIELFPNVSQLLVGESVEVYQKEVNIFQDMIFQNLEGQIFTINCDFEKYEDLIRRLSVVEFK